VRRFHALLFAACLVGCGADHGESDKGGTRSQAGVTAAGLQEHTLSHDGVERLYLAVSPGAAAAQSLPLVLVLHGGGGNARQAMDSMRLSDLVERFGALVVYPEGTSKNVLVGRALATWNAGACCGGAAKDEVDDVGFLGRVIDDVTARYPVDPRRVYVTGHSNGAMMSYRVGCELSDRIAAIAPVGGQNVDPACRPKRALPTLHLHGAADRCASYEGGTCGGCFKEVFGIGDASWTCASVPDAVRDWAKAQGCSGAAAPAAALGAASCQSFGCSAPAEVTLCTLPEVGHGFPGGTSPMCARAPDGPMCQRWQRATGPNADDFPTADVLWSFFSRHTR
jgi:polyhydroxybutyrate depolymerase